MSIKIPTTYFKEQFLLFDFLFLILKKNTPLLLWIGVMRIYNLPKNLSQTIITPLPNIAYKNLDQIGSGHSAKELGM